jgi:hypothetical protein
MPIKIAAVEFISYSALDFLFVYFPAPVKIPRLSEPVKKCASSIFGSVEKDFFLAPKAVGFVNQRCVIFVYSPNVFGNLLFAQLVACRNGSSTSVMSTDPTTVPTESLDVRF